MVFFGAVRLVCGNLPQEPDIRVGIVALVAVDRAEILTIFSFRSVFRQGLVCPRVKRVDRVVLVDRAERVETSIGGSSYQNLQD